MAPKPSSFVIHNLGPDPRLENDALKSEVSVQTRLFFNAFATASDLECTWSFS
jgi:hypothetical protein